MKYTKEEMEYLSRYEDRLRTAVRSDYTRNLPAPVLDRMHEIYQRVTGRTFTFNASCGSCVLALLKRVGTLYFDQRAGDTPALAQPAKPTAGEKTS